MFAESGTLVKRLVFAALRESGLISLHLCNGAQARGSRVISLSWQRRGSVQCTYRSTTDERTSVTCSGCRGCDGGLWASYRDRRGCHGCTSIDISLVIAEIGKIAYVVGV